jgi:hypothetical protein
MPYNKKTPSSPEEFLHWRIKEHERRIHSIESNKILTTPSYDPDNLPTEAVQGQLAIADPATGKPKTAWAYDDTNGWWQLAGINIDWIYVGTTGVDGIDSLLAANPHPYATGDTPGPVPFDNGTTIPANPLAFAKLDKALLLGGGHTGQTIFQSIFSLPSSYTPAKDQPIQYMFNDFSALAAANVQADSQVLYMGSSVITFT